MPNTIGLTKTALEQVLTLSKKKYQTQGTLHDDQGNVKGNYKIVEIANNKSQTIICLNDVALPDPFRTL